MPTVAIIGPYRFFFYSSDRAEPCHIHVSRERFTAKFWLDPARLEKSKGLSDHELFQIQKVIERNEQRFLEKWYEYFGA
jgi:hypothetical protein